MSKAMTDTELELRAEIEELKRQLSKPAHGHPSGAVIAVLAVCLVVAIVAGFLGGYLPRHRQDAILVAEAAAETQSVPVVNVVAVERSAGTSDLSLPGNIQAVTEAPILARASGYVKKRYADIGDRVKAGQLLAEIEGPELEQQVRQAKAGQDQAGANLEQAVANLEQGRSTAQLAKVTAARWKNLADRGVVSKQENDRYQSEAETQNAHVVALEKAVASARSSIGMADATLGRLTEIQGYQKVRAPFAGVITQRNVDVGALITEGNTLLFRMAQTDRLRTYINVPQADASAVRVGQSAQVTVADLPKRKFAAVVTRSANALDPATRTLLTEVQLSNADGTLMPGMYANVSLSTPRKDPPMLIPGDTLVVRAGGPQVAVVGPDKTIHFQIIQLGRDYGDRLEVLSGLEAGQQVVVNPGDSIREHVKVNPVALKEKLLKTAR